jgi:hypothetical protein
MIVEDLHLANFGMSDPLRCIMLSTKHAVGIYACLSMASQIILDVQCHRSAQDGPGFARRPHQSIYPSYGRGV